MKPLPLLFILSASLCAGFAEEPSPLTAQPLRLGQPFSEPVPLRPSTEQYEFHLAPQIGGALEPLGQKPIRKGNAQPLRNWLLA